MKTQSKKLFDYVITDVTWGKGKKAASPRIWRSTWHLQSVSSRPGASENAGTQAHAPPSGGHRTCPAIYVVDSFAKNFSMRGSIHRRNAAPPSHHHLSLSGAIWNAPAHTFLRNLSA